MSINCPPTSNKPLSPYRIALAVLLAAGLAACQPDSPILPDVSLAELTQQPQLYDGQTVRTRGTVRSFPQPRHYWLEGTLTQRVGLLPAEQIAAHVNRQVTVTGRFSYSPQRGRYLHIDAIMPYDAPR